MYKMWDPFIQTHCSLSGGEYTPPLNTPSYPHWSINGKYIIIPPPTPLPRVLHISLHARLRGLFICGEPAQLARLAKFMPRFPFKLLFCLWEGGLACLLRSWLGSSNCDWQQAGQASAPYTNLTLIDFKCFSNGLTFQTPWLFSGSSTVLLIKVEMIYLWTLKVLKARNPGLFTRP